ncbi:MAG: 3-deoxy-7-phosphoheptulonate synthase, partial [Plesiomonas sp.]
DEVVAQIQAGNRAIIGIMLESHLQAGNQSAEQPRDQMAYGVSVTDACIDWDSTETLLRGIHTGLASHLNVR